jgi:predicted nucleic acid-binding protein
MLLTDSEHLLLLDSGPVIYLAKVDALDVLSSPRRSGITEGVERETVMPEAAYRFPEIAHIEAAIRMGLLEVVALTSDEQANADELGQQIPGLGRGERETIAVASARGWAAVLFDRRARRIAEAFGVTVVGVFELLFAGTAGDAALVERVRRLAHLVSMRIEDLESILERVRERSR